MKHPLSLNDQPQGRLRIVTPKVLRASPLGFVSDKVTETDTGSFRRVKAVSFEKPSSVCGGMKGSKIITLHLLKYGTVVFFNDN